MQERAFETIEYLNQLRVKIPFLKGLPDSIYFRLDTSELYLPGDDIAETRSVLEEKTGHYLMTYKRDVFNLSIPIEGHLCANLKGADLTAAQLTLLQDYESRYRDSGVSFVAYQKPLEFTAPEASSLNRFYQQRGLLSGV